MRSVLRDEVAAFVERHGFAPCLLAVGSAADRAADTYLTLKLDAARNAGLRFESVLLDVDCDTAGAVDRIREAARDGTVHGIFVQYPLPGIDARACFDAIPVAKDIDGASSASFERLRAGERAFAAGSASAVVALLEEGDVALDGRRVFVARGGPAIAEPLIVLLERAGAEVVRGSADDDAMQVALGAADVAIFPAGVPPVVRPDWLRAGSVVVDGGYFGRRTAGDALLAEAAPRLGAIVPRRGGIGPVTVEILLRNTLDAARDLAAGSA